MNVPGFIARQFYVAGSLRNTERGFQLQAHNPMGPGVLVGVGQIRIDGRDVVADAVTAQRDGDPAPLSASSVSRQQPVHVNKGDRVTLHVAGEQLSPGEHKLEVELVELNVGRLAFSISDRIAEPPAS